MAHPERIKRQFAFVESASLDTLIKRFPAEWQTVGQSLVEATATRRPEAIEAFVRTAQEAALPYRQRVAKSRKNPQVLSTALPYLVRSRMAYLGAQRTLQAAALGAGSGRRRFGLWSGFWVSKLFFAHGLTRTPVSMRAFRWLWPLITQKRLLMPLVQPKGMYAFYSQELIQAIRNIIDSQSALEIAAGDGCLSRFLNEEKTIIRAIDDHSWSHVIRYPEWVEKLDAVTALMKYQPNVVVCSFPPPGNEFEAVVFQTPSVKQYVVLTTRHRFAAGNWQAYESQDTFDMQTDPNLTAWVLPPEIDPMVLVFTRKSEGGVVVKE
jgi:hypothetical protein